jgi:oleate hydratase
VAFFLPRADGDRPAVVPEHAVNFAFIGQFAETARDCIYTTEYSVRTGMEAVYTLLDVQRGMPEVWGSQYDIRALISSAIVLRDGKPLELPEPFMKLLDRTDIGDLLRQWGSSLPGGDPARTTPEERAVAEREEGTLL